MMINPRRTDSGFESDAHGSSTSPATLSGSTPPQHPTFGAFRNIAVTALERSAGHVQKMEKFLEDIRKSFQHRDSKSDKEMSELVNYLKEREEIQEQNIRRLSKSTKEISKACTEIMGSVHDSNCLSIASIKEASKDFKQTAVTLSEELTNMSQMNQAIMSAFQQHLNQQTVTDEPENQHAPNDSQPPIAGPVLNMITNTTIHHVVIHQSIGAPQTGAPQTEAPQPKAPKRRQAPVRRKANETEPAKETGSKSGKARPSTNRPESDESDDAENFFPSKAKKQARMGRRAAQKEEASWLD